MRQRLLLLLVMQGYDAMEAAQIVGYLSQDPFLGPLISGDPPQMMAQGASVQRLNEGMMYFAPFK